MRVRLRLCVCVCKNKIQRVAQLWQAFAGKLSLVSQRARSLSSFRSCSRARACAHSNQCRKQIACVQARLNSSQPPQPPPQALHRAQQAVERPLRRLQLAQASALVVACLSLRSARLGSAQFCCRCKMKARQEEKERAADAAEDESGRSATFSSAPRAARPPPLANGGRQTDKANKALIGGVARKLCVHRHLDDSQRRERRSPRVTSRLKRSEARRRSSLSASNFASVQK